MKKITEENNVDSKLADCPSRLSATETLADSQLRRPPLKQWRTPRNDGKPLVKDLAMAKGPLSGNLALRAMTKDAVSPAFTLLEMLVAMLILSTIIASVYSAFHAGVLASRRVLKETASEQNIMGRLNLMAVEIRNAVYWNNLVIAGTAKELYFYVPMMLKDPDDLLPLYRVRYWYEKSGNDSGTLYRSTAPWIRLQRPDMSDEEISREETTQRWMNNLGSLQLEYAVYKKKQPFVRNSEQTLGGPVEFPVEGNPDLVWKKDFDTKTQIPYGIRMRWKNSPQGDARELVTIFWPAVGLYQRSPTETTFNAATGTGVSSEIKVISSRP